MNKYGTSMDKTGINEVILFISGGFFLLLFLLFLGLKLAHFITWNWWLITSPLWAGPVVLFIGLGTVIGIVFLEELINGKN